MSLISSDLIFYGSANMQESDSASPQGGAIDTTKRVVFTDIGPTDEIELFSSSASDTGNVTIYGRSSTGSAINETKALSGTGIVTTSAQFERVLKVVAAAHVGTITLRDQGTDTSIMAIESGVLEVRRPFYNAVANAAGGADKTYYEKIFVKNTSATNALLNAVIGESSDGTEAGGADITFDIETAVNGTGSVTNRLTAPTGLDAGTFDDTNKALNDGDLDVSEAIGVWLKFTLPDGTSPMNTTFVLFASGETT